MTKEHKAQIIATLKRETGSGKAVTEFSNSLRILNLCDLSDDKQLEKAASSGMLLTLLTYHQLGLLPKLIEISNEVKNV